MSGRTTWMAVFILVLILATPFFFPALSPAGDSGAVTVSFRVGPCVSLTSGGEVRSNVSVTAFADASFLTVMAR